MAQEHVNFKIVCWKLLYLIVHEVGDFAVTFQLLHQLLIVV